MEAGSAPIILRMLNSEDHRALAERCVRLAQECSKPRVTQYLMALAADYLEAAELAGGGRRPPAPVIRIAPKRKNSALQGHGTIWVNPAARMSAARWRGPPPTS